MINLSFPRRLGFVLLASIALAAIFHSSILRLMALPIARGDQPTPASYLMFLRSARVAEPAFAFASEFAAGHPARRIIVCRDFVRRAEAIGATAPFVETAIAQLVDAGIPRQQIDVIGNPEILTTGETLSYAAGWLAEQSDDAEMLVVTHLFRTAYIASVADHRIEQPMRGRMHVIGFPRHGVNESNWWKNAIGLKSFFSEALRRVHLAVFGERRPIISWDPDVYEASLRELQP